jgi:hypothetical protein
MTSQEEKIYFVIQNVSAVVAILAAIIALLVAISERRARKVEFE